MRPNNSNKWGRYAWYKFHKMALKHPCYPCRRDRKITKHFYYENFLKYIRCESCKKHYIDLLIEYPIKTASRSDIFAWTVDIHNFVNAKLGKPLISYDEALQIWCSILSNPFSKYEYKRDKMFPF
jgi:hypothetical protein